jgi:hypothetical protein
LNSDRFPVFSHHHQTYKELNMKSLCVVLLISLASVSNLTAQTHWQRQSIGRQSVTAMAASDSLDYVAVGGEIAGWRDSLGYALCIPAVINDKGRTSGDIDYQL